MRVVKRDQVTDETYRVSVLDDSFSQETFQQVLTPEERKNWLPLDGFVEPAVARFPEHHGFYAYIRGKLSE